jgi:hypothetical protein
MVRGTAEMLTIFGYQNRYVDPLFIRNKQNVRGRYMDIFRKMIIGLLHMQLTSAS